MINIRPSENEMQIARLEASPVLRSLFEKHGFKPCSKCGYGIALSKLCYLCTKQELIAQHLADLATYHKPPLTLWQRFQRWLCG